MYKLKPWPRNQRKSKTLFPSIGRVDGKDNDWGSETSGTDDSQDMSKPPLKAKEGKEKAQSYAKVVMTPRPRLRME
jgi:hypothetical protein